MEMSKAASETRRCETPRRKGLGTVRPVITTMGVRGLITWIF